MPFMSTRPSCLLAASAVLLVAAAAPAHAQVEAHLGKTVVAIRLQIEDRPEESEQLRALIDIKVGQPLRAEDIRSTQVHFASIPRFEDVQVDVAEAPGGVAVTVRLIPRHPVDRIEIEGETGLDTGDLRELLLNRYGRLLPTAERTAEVEETVRRILVDEGFPKASVTAKQVLRHDPDRATLLINVVAGPRALISRTTVTGTSPFSSAQIIERTETAQGMPYRQRAIVTELADIRDELRSRNYYAAVATHTSRPTPEGVEVAINVDAGSPVEIRTEPPGALPQRDVEALIKRERSVDQDIIEQTQEDLTARLRRDGYWKATVTARREARDGMQVIVFGVDRGLRYRIDRIEIPQDLALPPAEIDKLMNLKSGQLFDQGVVNTGINRVLVELRRRGFYRAGAKPVYRETSRPGQSDEAGVIVTPGIDQGPLGKVGDIQFQYVGEHRLAESLLRAVMRSKVGEPYNPANRILDMDAMTTVYENQGFLNATIEVTPRFSEDGRDVTVVVNVVEGPQFVIADIVVIGNERVSREVILEEITLRPGQPFSRAEQIESQRRLFDMGVFRRVRIEDPRLAGETAAHVVISVEETPRHTIGAGPGLEAERLTRRAADGGVEDYLEVSPRAFFEIGRRNLGGRNRAINFFSRVSLGQRNVSRDPEDEGRGYGFSEYRATVTYRERRAFRTDTDLLVGLTSEQARRTSFNFIRQSITAEAAHALDRLRRVTVSGRYDLNFTRLFDNIIEPDDERNLLIDRLFPQVRLSTLSAGVIWDRRQPDPLSPSRGNLIGGDLEVAVRALGSEVGYAKLFFQISQFHALTTNRRFVLAGRAQLGLARGFEREVPETGDVIADLPASQRFFSGGGTSVRGFQLDRLAVPEVLNKDGLSVGGNALVVLNGEIRTIAGRLFNRQLGVVAFLDGGNVFARVGDLDFGRLRGAAGFGVRYDSPLGPVRLDIGFKLNRLLINGRRERGWEYHLSIGEAF